MQADPRYVWRPSPRFRGGGRGGCSWERAITSKRRCAKTKKPRWQDWQDQQDWQSRVDARYFCWQDQQDWQDWQSRVEARHPRQDWQNRAENARPPQCFHQRDRRKNSSWHPLTRESCMVAGNPSAAAPDEPEPKSKPGPEPEAEPGPKPEAEPEPEPGPEPGPILKPGLKRRAAAKPDLRPGPKRRAVVGGPNPEPSRGRLERSARPAFSGDMGNPRVPDLKIITGRDAHWAPDVYAERCLRRVCAP